MAARLEFHPLGQGNWPFTSGYRTPSRPNHNGDDIACYKEPLYASVTGEVWCGMGNPAGEGQFINIIRSDGVVTKCFHCSKIEVTNGQHVNAGQRIGVSGGVPGEYGAGSSTGAHLHFEIWEGGKYGHPTDPTQDLLAVASHKPMEPVPGSPVQTPVFNPEDDDMAEFRWQENAEQLWLVAAGTKCYIPASTLDGVDAEEFKAEAIKNGVVDNTQKPGAVYLSGLRDVTPWDAYKKAKVI